jgi:hypothetical protein
MSDEIHDLSRLDAFMAARRRAMVLHSAWRPMLAGAAGAALVVAAVWVTLPKFSVRDVVVDHVVTRDLPLNNPVPRDVPFDNHVPQNKPFDNFVPRNVPGPVAANPPSPPSDAPKTPDERKFIETPEYKNAFYRGRIVASRDGRLLSFADGTNLGPAHWDKKSSQSVFDADEAFDTDALVGLLAACVLDEHALWHCNAMQRNGQEITIQLKQKTANRPPPPPEHKRPLLIRLARARAPSFKDRAFATAPRRPT